MLLVIISVTTLSLVSTVLFTPACVVHLYHAHVGFDCTDTTVSQNGSTNAGTVAHTIA